MTSLEQNETPLLSALAQAASRPHAAFYAPGHKQGQGASNALRSLMGTQALQADLPELPELDNLFAPVGPLRDAQRLAAETFGAEDTFFLANGSTCGIEAAILAVCSPGQKILVPRNVHRSVLSALVLSGAEPIYLTPLHQEPWDLAFGVTAEQICQAFETYSDLQAVLIVSPSYQGVGADITAIANLVHANNCPLIVDEAHGSHLSFHPQFPPSAIASGADIAIQSTHKVLSALSQAAMLHVQGNRVDRDRLRQTLQLTQSTSPNALLLASLDAVRQQMATAGTQLMTKTLELASTVRSHLIALPPLRVLSSEQVTDSPGHFQLDPTRLVVDVSALGVTGFAADEFLHTQLGVTAELPTLRQLTFILSLGNSQEDCDRLVNSLKTLIQTAPDFKLDCKLDCKLQWPALDHSSLKNMPLLSQPPLSPRHAFFAESEVVETMAAIGRICADAICPYPPGIPVILPGEMITAEAISYLQRIRNAGGVITGSPDESCQSLRVVR
ncbi:aminotransferase class I/II-fold pyridoxal phosphate-dependent enzyme [Oscillatoria sp. CS-180]|uniref:aminotransferase class I/II-fold pyridoxal phosphate-dependent enzyme n=1 Tax=Oscillatoria sp. CS-180 TaxID=3021720 RepID=UPI0023306D26|nr:aminotransferase class I/II-fold pyridoxal phosphate-dependent enzyme [Oscillatoria sp. CS-180]MDB9529395.1 aminotransferase class I/II-fold pyridoxal phosphate-dependent enzyme [Oscillatoria sp. CS-180]